ncbi:DUF805 domain-containing protein [Ruegeria sp. HKCCD6604]|uniref:DUF805 domain-containing protein n=1 Tax=Ruegeria sp. HKCCD6604 TaxID=2683000 RepID=UPI0014916D9D|nr:DUF805 domain-containing protein [Ruegeria sp. HKCCD6604]NOC93483.1 DUF805 domain-containing protein [Ruegeria sp. HKCCD6604]
MGPKQAISTGIRKTFVFSGRASRSEFWWFAPIAIVLPISAALLFDSSVLVNWGTSRLLVITAASLPLLSAMCRRLQDTGEDGHQALYPFATVFIAWLGYHVFLGFGLLIGGPILLFLLVIFLFVPVFLIAIVTSALAASNVIGLMLVASDPDKNRFGVPREEGFA